MRPLCLEIEGFTSFREKTIIDFTDADHFVLVGPTGSGKSTIVDAICFALYGSVPRYEHRGLVAPVITQNQLQARVRLDFSLDDTTYTAVRVVRRQGGGASTKEARLESSGEVLAGNADELTEQVTQRIGLSYDHFTKCVVLPQGEFSRFLHDRPKDRQDLVVRLLNLGVYERMRQAAQGRAAAAKANVTHIERRLSEDFDFATSERRDAAEARVAQLGALRAKVEEAAPALERLVAEMATTLETAESARRSMTLLESLAMPEETLALAGRIAEARAGRAVRDSESARAGEALDVCAKAAADLPGRDPLAVALAAYSRRDSLAAKLESASADAAVATGVHEKAGAGLEAAQAELDAALEARTDLRGRHAAQHLATSLHVGEPCPVCLRPVDELPEHDAVPALDTADALVRELDARVRDAKGALEKAVAARSAAASSVAMLGDQIKEVEAATLAFPQAPEIAATLATIDAGQKSLEDARSVERAARRRAGEALRKLEELEEQEKKARDAFEGTRDRLVHLAPPPARRIDLGSDWTDLLTWAAKVRPELGSAAQDAVARAGEIKAARDDLHAELASACEECDVVLAEGRVQDAVVASLATAEIELRRIEEGIAQAKTLRAQLAGQTAEYELAHQLEIHLSAKPGRFESWIVGEALARLVTGATEILLELSAGQYGMSLDTNGNFLVTDHHNADETRSARTLSGGETFLASLSLALALSDQLAQLAAEGSARLDAIFLDEGFGTLDPETLDIVAATVENLASRGRMVGIVTHVRELAERVPVRFRVRKDARTSTVERVAS